MSEVKKVEKKPETKIVIKDNYNITNAKSLIELATVVKHHIVTYKLFTEISKRNYVHVEGWQFTGALLGLMPRVVSIEKIATEGKTYAYQVKVEIVDKSEKVVGIGFAMCSNAEDKKKSFDEYAVMSMAQTRAIGKAYRNIIGWVMKMSGYEGTPAEEMGNQVENEKARDSKIDTVVETIKSVRTPDAFNVLKDELKKTQKTFTKEEQKLIKKTLDEKENELSSTSA
jgi:roadblock/LC7 domain-containing protein